jgi:glycosyltransferase involved in cell wall biosynthesis
LLRKREFDDQQLHDAQSIFGLCASVKLCFLVSEYFRWGKHGGYGTSTRLLATALASRGFEVTVLTPCRGAQPPKETVDGVNVIAYPAYDLCLLGRHCRTLAADVYHSHEPSLTAVVARRAMPTAKHIVTCRDTRLLRDWLIEMSSWIRDGSYHTLMSFPYENNPCVTHAVRTADGVYCPNHFSRELAKRKYGLTAKPGFLPSPIRIPEVTCHKSPTPTVCYLGRWDSRKRPELFLQLADKFPHVHFIAIGKGRTKEHDRKLRQRYGTLPNVELPGFIDQFASPRLFELLSSSWMLVNTSLREGLPRSFMEAAASGCAILSRVDPDGFASRFGFRAIRDNFAEGLQWLLTEDRWRTLGQAARDYVAGTYGLDAAVAAHIEVYQSAFSVKTVVV